MNTSALELYPAVTRTWPIRRSELYFVSNRSGTLDIWRAVWEAVPEPSFTVEGPDANCAVTVDASASTSPEGTTPLRYRYDFGDGTTGAWSETGDWAKVSHTYAAPGRFLITLTVVNTLEVESTATAIVAISCSCAPGGDVAPWTAADVGWPLFPGRSWMDGDDLAVCAGGRGFVGSADEFHFVHRAVSGDFVLTVEVSKVLDWGGSGGSVGLMARDGLEPGARYASVLIEKAATVVRHRIRYREEPDASGRSRAGSATGVPRWLRLERCGDLFVARSSADGAAWEEVDRQEIAGMPATLLVGVAATGRDSGDPARGFAPLRARLSGLSIAPRTSGFVRGEANQDGAFDLSDAVAILSYLFLGGSLECLDAGDVDDDGSVVITDAIALLTFLFLGGPAPAAPYPDAGADPTEDELGCVASSACE